MVNQKSDLNVVNLLFQESLQKKIPTIIFKIFIKIPIVQSSFIYTATSVIYQGIEEDPWIPKEELRELIR